MNIAILQYVAVSARIEGRFTLESYMYVLQLAISSKLNKSSNDHWYAQYANLASDSRLTFWLTCLTVEALPPCQQFFSRVRVFPWLNQY